MNDKIKTVCSLRKQGKTIDEISFKSGLSMSTVSRILRQNHLTKKSDRPDITVALVESLFEQKLSVQQIADRLHCSYGTVAKRLNESSKYFLKHRNSDVVQRQSDFIDKARKIHGAKYDYSHVIYTTRDIKVDIICPTHGVFKQTPKKHLEGQGCPLCDVERRSCKDE